MVKHSLTTAGRKGLLRRLRAGCAMLLLSVLVLPLSSTPASRGGDAPTGIASAEPAAFPAGLMSEVALGAADIAPSADLYVADAGAHVLAERGGRVAPGRLAQVQPRFAAGRIAPHGLLTGRDRARGDSEMRTALAGPEAFDRYSREASLFRRSGTDAVDATLATAVAELKPSVDDAPRRAVPASREEEGAALVTAAAYAPADGSRAASLFDSVLGRKPGGFVPPIGKKDHAWAASVLPPSSFTQKEQTCLANGIYFEARGESELGQAAVAQVILNRVRNPAYPKTICGVVYQNKDWRNRCQFSFACDGIPDRIWNRPAFETAKRIANEVTTGETWLPEVGSATHYHATYVNPRWARTMQKVDKIGLHVFYRTFGGGWR